MPLLGSYGGSSEYAYRGTIDDFPNDFSFTNQTNAIPGDLFTSNQVTITGINNRALVRVSAGASVSVNGGSYVIPTEASPVFIRNNQTLSVRIPSTSGQLTDFNKLYSANVSVGRKTALWEVRTKIIDVDPTPFTFTNQSNREIGIAYTSNEITISGLEGGFSFPAEITSGSGQIIKNGGIGVPSLTVVNGDRIYLRLISPFEYSNNPTGSGTKTNTTSVQVGSYSTSWSVSSRDVDIFVDPFDFNDVNNALASSVYTAQSVNTLGVVTTITGADQGIPLVTAVTGCELQVEQPAAGGGFSIRRPFSTSNAVVFNGDRLTARIISGNFSEVKVGIVTVSNIRAQFIVTTRARPVDTIPDTFTFTDIPSQTRGSTVESNEITLVGMTTFTDEGDASITTGTNGGNAQFQVTRGTQIIKPFSATGSKVRNGDKIKLKITAASDQNITRTATFRVDGIDTSIVITGQTGFKDDIWSVVSATRSCDITPFTLATVNNANRSTVQTTTFTVNGFQSDCGMVVSTNVGSLSVQGSSLTNNIPVSPGTVVTLNVTSSASFGAATVATVTVSNTQTGVIPNKTYSTTWTINTVQDTTPASVTLTASPTSIALGESTTLTWTSVNSSEVTGSSGFTATSVSGSTQVTPTTTGTQSYSISVRPNPSASNFPTPVSSFASVSVTEDTTPDSFSLSPSSFIDQDKNFEVSATATVSGLGQNTVVFASTSGSASGFSVNGGGRVTQQQVRNGDSIRVFMTTSGTQGASVTGTLNIGSQSSSFTATTKACDPISPTNLSQRSYANGTVTVNFKAAVVQPALASPTPPFLYTSKSGGGLFQKCKADLSSPGGWSRAVGQTLNVPIPPGVTQLNVAAVGAGGGGLQSRGGGGGGFSRATVPFPGNGGTVTLTAAPISGQGTPGGFSSVQVNGVTVISAGGGTAGGPGGTAAGPGSNFGGGLGGTPLLGANGGVGGGSLGGGGGPGTPASTSPPNVITAGGSGGGIAFFPTSNGSLPSSFQPGAPATKLQPTFVVAANGPNNGGGGGGGGGGPSSTKTNGSSGSAVVAYAGQSVAAPTWDELINTIVNTYNSSASRPPRDSEMDQWTSTFTSNASLTLSALQTQITNAIGGNKASSVRDICGGTF